MSRFEDYRRCLETCVMKSATPNVVRELLDEIERLQATIERVRHFATGSCDMPHETRLRCIAAECNAEQARTA